MGTDIHGVFQRFDGGAWRDIESRYEQERDYQLFAVLTGIRNGFGFAGVPTGEAVNSIAAPRGLPTDFARDGHMHRVAQLKFIAPRLRKYQAANETLEIWMGDHSHSWLTGTEMLTWFEAAPEVVKTGILSRTKYEEWDGKSEPKEYSGGVSGPGVGIVNDNAVEKDETPGWTYIRCHWEISLKAKLAYFFDEVARLVGEHGNVRFVFGFDS